MVSEFIGPRFEVGKRATIKNHKKKAYVGKTGEIVRKGADTVTRGQIWVLSIKGEPDPVLCYEDQLEIAVGR